DGFALSGYAAVNCEAAGVSAERVSVGVYKVTGALGFAQEGWNIEVPQDVNGNRLCFVSTSTGKDGTIYVKVSKRRFDIDTAAIVAGEPMDIPAGRWIDLRLKMPVLEANEVVEDFQSETAEP
ncbi:phage tail protein, partial [Serratia marcescens]